MLGQILKKHDSSKSSSKYDTKDANALMKDLKNIINKKGSVSTQEFMQNLQNSTIGSMDQIEKDVEKFEKEMGLH